ARLGDVAAFTEVVRALHNPVFRGALTFARGIDEADEITQDKFIRLHAKLDQYRGESAVEGWVYLIVRRVALQRLRKARRRRWLSQSALPVLERVYQRQHGARPCAARE